MIRLRVMTGTVKCPSCGFESEPSAKRCACGLALVAGPSGSEPPKSLDLSIMSSTLSSIDASLKTLVNVAYWWLFLSIAAVIIYFTRYF